MRQAEGATPSRSWGSSQSTQAGGEWGPQRKGPTQFPGEPSGTQGSRPNGEGAGFLPELAIGSRGTEAVCLIGEWGEVGY